MLQLGAPPPPTPPPTPADARQIFNFALGYFVPPAFENIQWRVYLIFGAFCAAMTLHVFFLFPETAGKSLEQVEAMFDEHVPAWRTRVVRGALSDAGGKPQPFRRGDARVREQGSASPDDLLQMEQAV